TNFSHHCKPALRQRCAEPGCCLSGRAGKIEIVGPHYVLNLQPTRIYCPFVAGTCADGLIHARGSMAIAMQTLIVTNYQPGDEAWMFELQRKTLVRCPDSALMDPVSYRDPAFEQGLNIFCAFEGDKRLVGYGWIRPHRVLWLPEETLILPLD